MKIGQKKSEKTLSNEPETSQETPQTLSKKEKKQLDRRKKKTDKVQKEKKKRYKTKETDGNNDKRVLILGAIATCIGVALFIGQNFIIPLFEKQDGVIFMAKEEITSGSILEPEMLEAVEVDSKSILPSMVVNAEDLNGYASRTIAQGEPILLNAVADVIDEDDMNEYLYTSVALAGTPVLQDGAMVQVYVRSGNNVSLLFDEPKRVYANSTIGGYESESDIVENPNLLLTDEEFDTYQEALANEEIIVAARLYPDRIPSEQTTDKGKDDTSETVTEDAVPESNEGAD